MKLFGQLASIKVVECLREQTSKVSGILCWKTSKTASSKQPLYDEVFHLLIEDAANSTEAAN